LLIVNDRIDIALAIDADGVHIGQDDMPTPIARNLLGPERMLGVSAATREEAEAAQAAGADYLGVGPIYATRTKADAGPSLGPNILRELATHVTLPLIGIGGITSKNAREVMQAGASGIAVITSVVSADDIIEATRVLRIVIQERQ
jgi:thiamine-phosphate pyrophosphorylase